MVYDIASYLSSVTPDIVSEKSEYEVLDCDIRVRACKVSTFILLLQSCKAIKATIDVVYLLCKLCHPSRSWHVRQVSGQEM